LPASGGEINEAAAFLLNAVRALYVGGRDEGDENGGRFEIGGDFLFEVARFSEVFGVDPNIRARQETIEVGFKAFVEGADPGAVVTVGVADEDVVLEGRDESHGRTLV
jgi:hypothetical protein